MTIASDSSQRTWKKKKKPQGTFAQIESIPEILQVQPQPTTSPASWEHSWFFLPLKMVVGHPPVAFPAAKCERCGKKTSVSGCLECRCPVPLDTVVPSCDPDGQCSRTRCGKLQEWVQGKLEFTLITLITWTMASPRMEGEHLDQPPLQQSSNLW